MAMLTMPMLMANLGAEMLYILDQRLSAHSVQATKAAQVLDDIVSSMFDPEFVDTLFKTHEMYSVRSTHLIFSRLAHSSIMRLSTSSMEKLFDLILMGVKMQLLICNSAEAMLDVTRRHIATAKGLLEGASNALVDDFMQRLEATFLALTPGQWLSWRAKMTSFFLDRRIKVSLFLQEGIQAKDGHFYLQPPVIPKGAALLGTVKRFNPDGSVAASKVVRLACMDEDPNEYFCHPTQLGDNLYSCGGKSMFDFQWNPLHPTRQPQDKFACGNPSHPVGCSPSRKSPNRLKVMPPPRRAVDVRQRGGLAPAMSLAPTMSLAPQMSMDPSAQSVDRELQSLPTLRSVISDMDSLASDLQSMQEIDLLRNMFRSEGKAEFKLALFDDDDTIKAAPDPDGYTLDVSSKVRDLKLGLDGNKEYAGQLAAGLESTAEEGEPEEGDLLAMMDEAVAS